MKLGRGCSREEGRNPNIGRAEALRRSMLALMKDRKKPLYAHSTLWVVDLFLLDGDQEILAGGNEGILATWSLDSPAC